MFPLRFLFFSEKAWRFQNNKDFYYSNPNLNVEKCKLPVIDWSFTASQPLGHVEQVSLPNHIFSWVSRDL